MARESSVDSFYPDVARSPLPTSAGYGSAGTRCEGYLPGAAWRSTSTRRFIFFEAGGHIALGALLTRLPRTFRLYGGPQECDFALPLSPDELASSGWTGGTVGLEMGSYRPNRRVSRKTLSGCAGAKTATVVEAPRFPRRCADSSRPPKWPASRKPPGSPTSVFEAPRETAGEDPELELWGVGYTAAMTRPAGVISERDQFPLLVSLRSEGAAPPGHAALGLS